MDLNEVVAANLRRIRHARKMTQEDLADKAGVSARYLGSAERAAASVTITVLGKLADALEVEPGALVERPRGRRK